MVINLLYRVHGVFRSMLDQIVVQLMLQPHMANWMQCQKTCDVIFYRGGRYCQFGYGVSS